MLLFLVTLLSSVEIIVQCDFSQLKGGREQEINRQSGGKYMVASVCHRITGKDTLTSLGLLEIRLVKRRFLIMMDDLLRQHFVTGMDIICG